jgi:membrane dipeptidase
MPQTQDTAQDAALAAALDLLDRVPLVDGHNDLAWVVREAGGLEDLAGYDLTRLHPETDTDIPRLRAGKVGAQVLAAYLPTAIPHPAMVTLEQIDLILRIEALHADVFHPCRRADDVAVAHRLGKIGSILSVEGTVGLRGSMAPLRIWQKVGVRLVTLCHNETLPWVDSATDAPSGAHGGLSEFGVAIIAEMNRLGLMVDLAHAAPHAMHKVLDVAKAPLLISHSCAATLCPHPRNTPDDVLDRLPGTGSVIMATFVPEFLNPASWNAVRGYKDKWGKTRPGIAPEELMAARHASIAGWEKDGIAFLCDHLDCLKARVGEDHVGIGSDFYGGPNPPGLEDAACYPSLIAELIRRGWTHGQLEKLINGNALRVWRAVEDFAR